MQLTAKPPKDLSTRQEKLLVYWASLQHEMLYLCWGVMDVALLTPLAIGVMSWARYWPSGTVFLGLLLVMFLAFNLARLLSALYVPPEWQQVIMALALLLVVFFSLRTLLHTPASLFDISWVGDFFANMNEKDNQLWQRDVVLFLLVILMWARGLQMATRTFTINRIGLRLRVGGLIIAPLVAWLSSRGLFWGATQYVLLFFLAGLTAVALVRAEEIAQEETGYSASLSPRWLGFVILAGLLIVAMAGLVAALISRQSATVIAGFLAPVWLALGATVVTAVAAVSYLFSPLAAALEALLSQMTFEWAWLTRLMMLLRQFARQIQEQRLDQTELEGQEVTIEGGLSANSQIITVLLSIALILAVTLVLQQAYRRTAVRARLSGSSHGRPASANDDEGWLQNMLGRLGLWRHWRTATSIRIIYQQMMALADANGYPKLDTETPYEYLKTLVKAWPHNQADTHLITTAYVKVRYGEIPETQAEIDEIRQAWQHLKQAQSVASSADKA